MVWDYDGSCDFVVGGDTGLQVVCTHTCDTTYQYHRLAIARALVTRVARARVDI